MSEQRCSNCGTTAARTYVGSLCLDCAADASLATAEAIQAELAAKRAESRRHRARGYAPYHPHPTTQRLLACVAEILREYADHLPLTVRQIFYRLVGAYGYEKTEAAYEGLGDKLVRARRAGMIPFNVLRDDGASVMRDDAFGGIEDFFDDVGRRARNYRRDKQAGQRAYIELWCEAAGMQPQLANIAEDYSVPVYSGSGFDSLTAKREVVERIIRRNVPTVMLHVGDFDPSGESIFDSLATDAVAFLERDALLPGVHRLISERVALTAEQVEQYALPTAPPNKRDTRSKRWRGDTCQAEALPPDNLAMIVRSAIESYLDLDVLREHVEAEGHERMQILRALPSGEDSEDESNG